MNIKALMLAISLGVLPACTADDDYEAVTTATFEKPSSIAFREFSERLGCAFPENESFRFYSSPKRKSIRAQLNRDGLPLMVFFEIPKANQVTVSFFSFNGVSLDQYHRIKQISHEEINLDIPEYDEIAIPSRADEKALEVIRRSQLRAVERQTSQQCPEAKGVP